MTTTETSASGSSCVLQIHGGGGVDRHRISRTHDSEFCFACCARPNRGPHPGPATPHRNRAYTGYGHETSPQRGRLSPREVPRPTAASARRSEHDSAAAVRSGRIERWRTCCWRWRVYYMASWKVKSCVRVHQSEGGGESPESPESQKSARQITRIRRANHPDHWRFASNKSPEIT